MADTIIVLDGGDEEVSPQPSSCASPLPPEAKEGPSRPGRARPPRKAGQRQTENDKRFAEFLEHCSTIIPEHPEILSYLQTRHTKASPDFLSSVEFRNTLERYFALARKNTSKICVFINELCTVLRQRSAKRKVPLVPAEPATGGLIAACQSTSVPLTGGARDEADAATEVSGAAPVADDHEPSTSGVREVAAVHATEEEGVEEKKKRRRLQKQIAYLENLLRVFNQEIHNLQQKELSLDDLACENSLYIQEHKLKRKMMKVYEKLCELKGCDTLTGRVIEQRIRYTATRYPEINKKIERYINSPEVRDNPPDYQDIHRQVCRANERYKLGLNRKHLNQLAKEAFRDIGTSIQHRRQLDLVYNFGSHLTDNYKPAEDPALSDPSLLRKLKTNREESLSRLEEVIAKFANKQEDTEEQERTKRQQKAELKFKNENENKNVNGANEEKVMVVEDEKEEEEEEEEDESSDPDIEEEIQASIQQADVEDDNEAERGAGDAGSHKDEGEGAPVSSSHGEADLARNGGETSSRGFSPLSESALLPLSNSPSDGDDEQQQQQQQAPLANGKLVESEEEKPAVPCSQGSAALVDSSSDVAVEANLAPSPRAVRSSGTSPPPYCTGSQKRKRKEMEARSPQKLRVISNSEVDIPLDMGVLICNSPGVESTPAEELVSSTQLTPPPKKNKVNVSTQCDPLEVIVLSDSE